MNHIEQPINDSYQRPDGRDGTVRLGDVVQQLMENIIGPQQTISQAVAQVWSELLPQDLRRHCRIVDIANGQIKVQVDSPVYMYELRLCSSQLKDEIARLCPRAHIRQIKLSIG